MKRLVSKLESNLKKAIYLDSSVTIRACTEVRIENCIRVLECDEILIRIRTSDCDVSLWGENLIMECYNENIITVHGKIKSLDFEAKKK